MTDNSSTLLSLAARHGSDERLMVSAGVYYRRTLQRSGVLRTADRQTRLSF